MYKLILTTLFFLFITTSSFAYLGPGVGGGLIAVTIGIIVAIGVLDAQTKKGAVYYQAPDKKVKIEHPNIKK